MKRGLPKFFYKGFNDSFCCSCAGHPNALRGHLKRKQSSKVGNKWLGSYCTLYSLAIQLSNDDGG